MFTLVMVIKMMQTSISDIWYVFKLTEVIHMGHMGTVSHILVT